LVPQVFGTVLDAPVAVAPVKKGVEGLSLADVKDMDEWYPEEPSDPTPEELAELSRQELQTKIKDGRTVEAWLQQEQPRFSDGGLVGDWLKEAHRLRTLTFEERMKHLVELSFEDMNAFRARSKEWRHFLMGEGILEQAPDEPDEGVRTRAELGRSSGGTDPWEWSWCR
jgi:hypothetical protein